MPIAAVICMVRAEFISAGFAPSYYEINNGLCDDFATTVSSRLKLPNLQEYGSENFMCGEDGDLFENDIWDWSLLRKHWAIVPPSGLTEAEVNDIAFGAHVWLSDGRLHYDAECPAGVSNFFDLPIFRRYVITALRRKGISTPDVVTEDLIDPPHCPVLNPG